MNLKTKCSALIIGMMVVLLFGCQSAPQNQPAETSTPQKTDQSAKKATGSQGSSSKMSSSAGNPVTLTPRPTSVTVPAGTTLSIRLVEGIDTGTTPEGSSFEGTLAGPLMVSGTEVAAVGSSVTGKVTNVVSSGRLSKPAELSLTLTSLTPNGGGHVAISTNTWSMKGESHKKRDIEMMGGGAAAGAVIGAIAGGKKGAAIGTLVGGGGGTAVAAETGKKEIRLPSETKLSFTLSQAITLPAR
jgi:FlaG/FlaF family flagellin (archaellin)